jgi:hypothetical protein
MRRNLLVFSVAALALTACHPNIYNVSLDASSGGVPFFPFESVDKLELTYEQPWIEVTVVAKLGDGAADEKGASAEPPASPVTGKIDINSATQADIEKNADLKPFARKIIASRPYTDPKELKDNSIVPEKVFAKVSDKLVVGSAMVSDKLVAGSAKVGGGDTKANTRTVTAYYANEAEAAKLYNAFIAADDDPVKAWGATAGEMLKALGNAGSGVTAVPPAALAFDAIRAPAAKLAAVARSRQQVPASEPLYFNATVPFGGTASAEIDLNDNGTLSKGIASKTDQFPGQVLSAVGAIAGASLGDGVFNTIAKSNYRPLAAHAIGGQKVLSIEVSLSRVRRLYVVSVLRPSSVPEVSCGPFTQLLTSAVTGPGPAPAPSAKEGAAPCRASIVVTVQRDATAGADDKAKKSDADKVEFSGSVTLPGAGATGADKKQGAKK